MKYDLVIIGTGFSGTFFLKKYKEKYPDARVLVLERGRKVAHAERLTAAREEKGIDNMPNPWQAAIQKNDDRHQYHFDLAFGGGSNSWWACTPRFLPQDFRLFSLYGQGQDWPISYEDLIPYYTQAEQWMEVSGPAETPFPKIAPYPLPAHKILPFDAILQKKFGSLVHAQATARSPKGGSRTACCANSTCHVCPIQSKFTISEHFSECYEGVELISQAQVVALDLQNGLAQKAIYLQDGKENTVEAELFVLAANPIFNSHIMLNSGDDSLLLGTGVGEQRSLYAELMLGIDNRGGSTTITSNMWMLYDGAFRKEMASCLIESHNPPELIRIEKGKLRHIARFKFIFEDLYKFESAVRLSANRHVPIVSYKGPSDYLKRSVKNLPSRMEKLLRDFPVESISYDRRLSSGESHIIGGHVMGNDPSTSVVDHTQRHHKFRNVYLLGAGSFSSMAAANPSLTLSAMAIRSADLI
ncbi:MAG: GMC family oxidoreductase [Bacteroidia bacterium]|nr:GMC family oxidoreductase [Bacteroidia bacterium]